MATELVIRSWCDPCLEAGRDTPGDALTIPPLFGGQAFDVEACPEHATALREAVEALRPFGRKVGTGTPKTPGKAAGKAPEAATRTDQQPHRVTCPECGHVSPSLSAMRHHLRDHGKSLADVGLAEARATCDVCGSKYPNATGLSAHVRSAHPAEWAAAKQAS